MSYFEDDNDKFGPKSDDEDDDTWLSRLDDGDEEACCPVL